MLSGYDGWKRETRYEDRERRIAQRLAARGDGAPSEEVLEHHADGLAAVAEVVSGPWR